MKKLFLFAVVVATTLFVACKPTGETPDSPNVLPDGDPVKKNAVLVEEFTGTWCPYCPIGAKAIHEAMSGMEDKVILVAQHVGDEFEISHSRRIASLLRVEGYPYAAINRTKIKGAVPSFNAGTLTKTHLKTQLAVPSYVALDMNTSYDESSKKLTVEVSGELLKQLPDARLNVYVTQDGIVRPQKNGGATTSDYRHAFALRKVLSTDNYGDRFDITRGKFTKKYEYVIPSSITGVTNIALPTDVDNMYVVAFVADFVSRKTVDVNKNIVHNAIQKKIK